MVAADREHVTITAEDEYVEIGAGQRDAAGERERAAMNVMRTVSLDEIGEAAGATDTGYGGDFFLPEFAAFDQFEIERQYRKITTTRTPGGMIGSDLFLG